MPDDIPAADEPISFPEPKNRQPIKDITKPSASHGLRPGQKRVGRGKTKSPVATKETVAKALDLMVKDVAADVARGIEVQGMPKSAELALGSTTTRRNLLAILGPDIESARAHFADKLLATANKIHDRIEREVDDLPASSLAFTMAVLVDKQEVLRAKNGATATGAKVGGSINVFMDGAVDREAIMRTLLGQGIEQKPAIDVTPAQPPHP